MPSIRSAPGALVILDPNTDTPSVFWKGAKIENLTGIRVVDGKVVLTVTQTPLDLLYAEMEAAGVKIKKAGAGHV